MNQIGFTPAFRQSGYVVSPPKTHKTQGEVFKEKTERDAEKAKEKELKERNLGDHLAIGMDTLSKMSEPPVVYANSSHKLNYMI